MSIQDPQMTLKCYAANNQQEQASYAAASSHSKDLHFEAQVLTVDTLPLVVYVRTSGSCCMERTHA